MPVEVGQAGGQAVCTCGALLDVPPLRKLRHLPMAPVASAASAAGPRWAARHGVIAASLALAVLLGIAALVSWLREPTMPKFDPVAHLEGVESRLKAVTPAQSWGWWTGYYRPLAERGFPTFQVANAAAIDQQIARHRFLERTLLSVAGLCAAVAVAAAVWPRRTTKTRRGR